MKKIILTVIAMMAIATTTFAENETKVNENTEKIQYTFNFNNDRIANYLCLDEDQKADMESIHNQFTRDMARVFNTKVEKRSKFTKRAIYQDLGSMRYILNDEQYAKYRMLLQNTLTNRGIVF